MASSFGSRKLIQECNAVVVTQHEIAGGDRVRTELCGRQRRGFTPVKPLWTHRKGSQAEHRQPDGPEFGCVAVQPPHDDVLFVPLERAGDVAEVATKIRDTERYQAARMQQGTTFRRQARLGEYIAARNSDEGFTFREHLRSFGGEIEE